jgi:protein phosphatase-4 regulatory subunit 3
LVVKSEVDGSNVLNSKILQETEYSRQQDTLILWCDDCELALSFQELEGCEILWHQINDIQKRMAADMHGTILFIRY